MLKPGGTFIGAVSFLEPFHGNSFYHHTHLGVFNSLSYGGFSIEKIAPNATWSGLAAQSAMGLFPKMPMVISNSIITPVQLLHKIWWKARRLFAKGKTEDVRIRNNTGAFFFIAKKYTD